MPFKFNPFTGKLDVVNPAPITLERVEQFVPFKEGLNKDSPGIKGQWSYSPDGNYWECIATDSWLEIYGKTVIDAFNFLSANDLTERFVPSSLVTGPNAPGIKGQWTFFDEIYKGECIATNTWVKYAVATTF